MKKKNNTLVILTIWLLLLGSMAQASAPPPFVIHEEQLSSRITIYAEYLLDENAAYTLDDVRTTFGEQFTPASTSRERLGFQPGVLWMRIALSNAAEHSVRRILEVSPGLFRQLVFFEPIAGRYEPRLSGLDISPPWADIRHRHQLFILDIPAQESHVYYLRITPNLSLNFSIAISTTEKQLERSLQQATPFWLLTGIVCGLILLGLGLYASTLHKAHLYYSLFLLSFLVSSLTSAGFLMTSGWPIAGLHAQLEVSTQLLAMALSALFTSEFLRLKNNLLALHLLMKLLASSYAVLALTALVLPPYLAGAISSGAAIVCVLLLFFVGIRGLSSRLPQARFYLTARTPLLLIVVSAALANMGILQISTPIPFLLLAAASVEAMLFAGGLTTHRERQLHRTMQSTQREAMEELAWRTRNDTLSRISHEIRTPMSGILGMSELLADTPLTPNQKECVRTIHSSGENLLRTISDVLEYTRQEKGSTDLNRDQFDLPTVVMDALELFRERAEEKGVELIAHIHNNTPLHVEGDPNKLRQVITSVLAACVRYATQGEIILDVGRDTSGRTNHIRFEIEGSAIEHGEEFLTSMYDESNDHNSSHSNSTGLSLTIARQLTETMGGQCGLRKGRRHRCVCWLSIPLPATPDDETLRAEIDSTLLSGRNILVVDDSTTVTRVVRQQALNWGMRVTICHDPREALAAIRTQTNINEPFDIVLLDQNMPVMNGIQLATRIQEDSLIPQPPALVMLTGIHDAPTATQARNNGIHTVLTKPVSGRRLQQALIEALNSHTSHNMPIEKRTQPTPGLRILVAEDHLLSQKVIRGMLDKLGQKADIVANGKEALEAVQHSQYDIVLMDCDMPEMDGFEATRRIRSWEQATQREPTPVVALTAHILREHKERSIASGMNAHVAKPIELSALSDVLVRFSKPSSSKK